jgi:hypothetical protein
MRISRTLGIAHGTVRKYAHAMEFPERAPHRRQRSILDPYLVHLQARHAAGCENSEQLWREIRRLGYSGTQQQVRRWLQERRRHPAPTTPHQYRQDRLKVAEGGTHGGMHDASAVHHTTAQKSMVPPLPSPTQLSWLLIRPPESLSEADAWIVRHVLQDSEATGVVPLVQRFAGLIRDRTADPRVTNAAFDVWLDEALSCGVRTVEMFARGLEQDGAAVRAALTTPWSNGQTEGQITKLKLLKRQMYGRAKFDLLRRRVLLAA